MVSRQVQSDVNGQQLPRAIVDGGGSTWSTLSRIANRRIADLATGEVLEIISLEPSMRDDVAEWCRLDGHLLVQASTQGDGTRFWIQKQ